MTEKVLPILWTKSVHSLSNKMSKFSVRILFGTELCKICSPPPLPFHKYA